MTKRLASEEHVRESATPGAFLPDRPELAGLVVADCSCGAEYTAPEGEIGALDKAHKRHVAEVKRGSR